MDPPQFRRLRPLIALNDLFVGASPLRVDPWRPDRAAVVERHHYLDLRRLHRLAAAYAPPKAHSAPGLFIARAMFYVCRAARGRVLSITKASGTPRS